MLKAIAALFLAFAITAGCSSPAQRFTDMAGSYAMQSRSVAGKAFKHRIYIKADTIPDNPQRLHVYIDGDGTPWEHRRWPSADPTSRNPLILHLMQADPNPALLLGRPCYHGIADSKCQPKYWTSHRYSDIVVESMVQALNNWLRQFSYQNLVLIGYSGGGTLAVLMAARLENISSVVTLAANLDMAGWSLHHGYQPLQNSLDPIKQPPLPEHIKQFHFAGLDDENVPSKSIERYSDQQSNANYIPLADYDHACCWQEDWVEKIKRITTRTR